MTESVLPLVLAVCTEFQFRQLCEAVNADRRGKGVRMQRMKNFATAAREYREEKRVQVVENRYMLGLLHLYNEIPPRITMSADPAETAQAIFWALKVPFPDDGKACAGLVEESRGRYSSPDVVSVFSYTRGEG